jgi:hypothetical protein
VRSYVRPRRPQGNSMTRAPAFLVLGCQFLSETRMIALP